MRISPHYKERPCANWALRWWLDLVRWCAQLFSGPTLIVAVVAAGGALILAQSASQRPTLKSILY